MEEVELPEAGSYGALARECSGMLMLFKRAMIGGSGIKP